MPNWSGGILTTKGQALQAKVDAGQTLLTLTKMKIGSGVLPSGQSLQSLNDLVVPEMNVPISAVSAEGNISTIAGVITNAGLTNGFNVRELGVFAQDPTLGEILYSITTDSAPDYLPPEGGAVTVSSEFNYHITVSNAANVTATLDPSGLVTVSILQQHKTASILDHPDNSVTDAKIGNRTITDTVTATTGAGTLTNLLSKLGNMIKQITGKSTWYTAPATTLEAANTHITASSSAHAASAISSTATGDVAATNVQAAIAELASEKAAISASFTNRLTDPTNRDLNNFKGVDYYWHFDTGGGAVLSTPYGTLANATAQVGTVRNYGINTNRIAQHLDLYYGNVNPLGTWCRFYNGDNNTWSAWKRLATMELVAPAGYGLGANAKNVETNDINTIIVTGWYAGWGDTKTPSPGAGYTLRVDSRNANFDHATQEIAHDAIPNMRWTRSCASGVWSSWKQIATTDQIPTTAAQVGAAPDGYGLGRAATAATENWNNYYASGFYVGLNLTNAPTKTTDAWYLVNVICYNTSYIYQQAHGFSGAAALTWERTCNNGVWSVWRRLATTDITFIDRGNAPLDWNSITAPGSYWVHPDFQVGQIHSAVVDLGMYQYGQLVVSGNGGAIQQTYYSHKSDVAVRMLYSGSSWSPWRKLANTDSIPAGAGAVKAHVNFSYEGGVITIRNSFNVSSVVRTSGGQYTINFATPLASANYTVQCTAAGLGTGVGQGLVVSEYMSATNVYGTKTTNAIAILTVTNNDSDKTVADVGSCNVTILQ